MKPKTLKQLVLEHMEEKGTIHSWDAIRLFHLTRLSDVIFRLKKDGHDIDSSERVKIGREHYTIYKLIKKEQMEMKL